MEHEIQTVVESAPPAQLSVGDLKKQVQLIQEVMAAVMQDGEHYGRIPGAGPKKVLLKPGAEKLCHTFRLSPTFGITRRELEGEHREYEVVCTVQHITSGQVLGQGVGLCTTREKRYRYVRGQERTDLADTYNTVLKMAKKRALVDAVLTATAASDCFTQDLEDMPREEFSAPPRRQQQAAPKKSPQSTAKQRLQPALELCERLGYRGADAWTVITDMFPHYEIGPTPERASDITDEQMEKLVTALQEEIKLREGSEVSP